MGAGWLNLGSILFGLVAMVLPLINLAAIKRQRERSFAVLSLASAFACALAVCLQLFYSAHLVSIKDWSALMDTEGVSACVGATLLLVTAAENAFVLVVRCLKKSR